MVESQRQITTYLVAAARAVTDRAAQEVDSAGNWEKVRAQRLEEMRDMLGLLPWPQRTPLNVRITGVLDRPEFTIEKIAFESLPKFYVTGNLYLPKRRPAPAPRRLSFYGHRPREFEYTQRIYGLYGKRDHVFTSMSVEGPLEGRYHHGFASGM